MAGETTDTFIRPTYDAILSAGHSLRASQ